MGEFLEWWLTGGDWYDWRQKQRIDDLAAGHEIEQSRLSSKLRAATTQSENLGQRIDRLERAVGAIIQLEDTRGDLTAFAGAAAARRYARDVVSTLRGIGHEYDGRAIDVPPDVPGYWLHPAVVGLDASLAGRSGEAEEAFAQAARRDPTSTAIFRACVDAVREWPARTPSLSQVWPSGRAWSADQRAMWLGVADGRYVQAVEDELAAVIGRSLQVARTDGDAGVAVGDDLRPRLVAALLARPDAEMPPLAAARLLARLRAMVDEIVGGAEAGAPGGLSAGPADPPLPPADDPLAELLARVVSRGAPEEQPVIERMMAMWSVLGELGVVAPEVTEQPTDVPAGDVADLLVADLWGENDRSARRFAARVAAEPIARMAESLTEQAKRPVATETAVDLARGVRVTVTAKGATGTSWKGHIAGNNAQPETRSTGMIVAVGVALLGAVLGLAVHPGWSVLTVAALIVAIALYASARRDRLGAQREAGERANTAQRRIDEASRQVASAQREAEAGAAGAERDLGAIRLALGSVGRESPAATARSAATASYDS